MAAKAYVLIETAVGKSREIQEVIRGITGVSAVDHVTGPYDIIAVVEANDLKEIGDVVTGRIHPVAGITRTVTCLAI